MFSRKDEFITKRGATVNMKSNNSREVLAAASLVIWDTLGDMKAVGDMTTAQHAAWVSSPTRDTHPVPNN